MTTKRENNAFCVNRSDVVCIPSKAFPRLDDCTYRDNRALGGIAGILRVQRDREQDNRN